MELHEVLLRKYAVRKVHHI